MYFKFNVIINNLKSLDKFYTEQAIMRKILKCLPGENWGLIVIAIEEVQELKQDDPLGSLLPNEISLIEQSEDQP